MHGAGVGWVYFTERNGMFLRNFLGIKYGTLKIIYLSIESYDSSDHTRVTTSVMLSIETAGVAIVSKLRLGNGPG